MASHENHTWVHAIYFMLNRNGFKQTWPYHPDTSSNFHVILKQCLVDQFIQQCRCIIGTSKRFCLLNAVKPTFQRSNYKDTIKSPDVRLTFTLLRVDCYVYSAYSRGKEIGTYTCPLCYRGEDSVKQLLCRHPSFQGKREILFQEITNSLPGWAWMNDFEILHTLFKGLSPVTRNLCCQSARGNRSGAVRYFPEAVRPRGNTATPDRFPRADWQHKFLVTGLNPDYNMVTVRVKHRKVLNRGFRHHGRHFVLRRFWRFPLWFTPPPTLKI